MSRPPPIQFPPKYAAQRGRQWPGDLLSPMTTARAPHRRMISNDGCNGLAENPSFHPERRVAVAPSINLPAPTMAPSGSGILPFNNAPKRLADSWDAWRIFSHAVTLWAPAFLLSTLGRMKDNPTRQAWREKVALCVIAAVLGVTMGFSTAFLDKVLCPDYAGFSGSQFRRVNTTETKGLVSINGYLFNITNSDTTLFNYSEAVKNFGGADITPYFTRTAAQFNSCSTLSFKVAKDEPCPNTTSCVLPTISTATLTQQKLRNTTDPVGYDWSEVGLLKYYLVINGFVLNFTPYFAQNPTPIPTDAVDVALRTVLKQKPLGGKDATRLFSGSQTLNSAYPCLLERYYAGNIDRASPGCFITSLFLYSYLVIIIGVVFSRFFMAVTFDWFLSRNLVKPPKGLGRNIILLPTTPKGVNTTVNNQNSTALWAKQLGANNKKLAKNQLLAPYLIGLELFRGPSGCNNGLAGEPVISMATIGRELFCVCLVTCYSEGRDLIKGTLDSIALTKYSDSRKLLFVVCDGIITGAGETQSAPDICVSLLDTDPRFGDPTPMGYVTVGLGSKKENRAMVYAGHYVVKNRRTPTVIIVKCGTEAEVSKPGNRGKRDSQLVLMNFFSRVTYNDPFSPLDYDLFRKVRLLMGVTPDFFEVTLMVDADTKVHPESIQQLVNCMHNDHCITGVCGETRIANKRQSWVTAIQVYEYFLSHHLAKAFESVFGGVTYLPGCFSMYRLKVRKANSDEWVPLITKREIIREYGQSEVRTLHQKNLLLLGEDRFLTTILFRAFPNRKMIFCPQARCHTIVPDTFSVLLSQRRRWINSTVHSLMELVLVRNLCGTFCFSMQFVVFIDLLGTVVLPGAVGLTYYLAVNMALHPPQNFEQILPLMILYALIGLPAVLILITTRKVVYVFWMFIYFAALPIWTFVLPVYSFWHFDDFSWGQTRLVDGEGKQRAHATMVGTSTEGTQVPFRRWEDWERSRICKLKREGQRKRDMERSYPGSFCPGVCGPEKYSMTFFEFNDTDNSSLASSDDDRWGA